MGGGDGEAEPGEEGRRALVVKGLDGPTAGITRILAARSSVLYSHASQAQIGQSGTLGVLPAAPARLIGPECGANQAAAATMSGQRQDIAMLLLRLK